MATFIERLEAMTSTYDRQLESEIYFQLYREDLLRAHDKTEEDVVEQELLWSNDKATTIEEARAQYQAKGAKYDWHGTWQIWTRWKDGTTTHVGPPAFLSYFDYSIKLIPKGTDWACGKNGDEAWCTIGSDPPVTNAHLTLAVAIAAVKRRLRDMDGEFNYPQITHPVQNYVTDPF